MEKSRMKADPLHTFRNMKSRCYNPKDKKYKYYGGKGIIICQQWLRNPVSFATWAENNGWGLGKRIHRINHKGNYEPTNCIFIFDYEHTLIHAKERCKYPWHEVAVGDYFIAPRWSSVSGTVSKINAKGEKWFYTKVDADGKIRVWRAA